MGSLFSKSLMKYNHMVEMSFGITILDKTMVLTDQDLLTSRNLSVALHYSI